MKYKVNIDLFVCSNYSITPNVQYNHYLLLMSNQKAVICEKQTWSYSVYFLFADQNSERWAEDPISSLYMSKLTEKIKQFVFFSTL